ncbi:hypothetical protein AJ79_06535 [Helicocarpus griseus UAMH5409]|uniref:Tyrosine decarboxylase n=1 Tax=Helicocarpus griseus UAMH5409 TaxID=1447875 RepID=A0A2B7XBU6_9EURO|nr:hypothetical protein AJ79_06535 [Helicocarpus griseus UAMH5409]
MTIQPLQSPQEEEPPRQLWQTALTPWTSPILPSPASLSKARSSLITSLPTTGLGFSETKNHIANDIIPGFNGSSLSANYYGFVTGGVTPAALLADNIVSAYDQNVQVHIPGHSVATDVEDRALTLLLELFDLDQNDWPHKTLTTGATASNVLGLALGREFVLRAAVERKHGGANQEVRSVAEYGVAEVLPAAGLKGVQVLSTYPHSSLGKAAGILGIGRANVKSVCAVDDAREGGRQRPLEFDFQILERELARGDMASIVAVSCGEVNTGQFATTGIEEFRKIRQLCDKYGAWLHVDGAFGMFSRILKGHEEFDRICKGCEGLELADSITGDGHKLLNVPYDCGFFFSRHAALAEEACRNPNAAYLSAGGGDPSIPSPNNNGIENSRRLRALPVYATLVAYGKDGYRDMLERQIRLARSVVAWLLQHTAYTVLPGAQTEEDFLQNTFMVVLFRAKDDGLNEVLVSKINATSEIYVSGTRWEGKPACRIAISNWRVNEEKDFETIIRVLEGVAK